MKKILIISYLLLITLVISQAQSIDIPDGDVAALITAFENANSNGVTDTINLAPNGTYTFTSSYAEVFTTSGTVYAGKIALPRIQSLDWPEESTLDMVINGNGSTFVRASSEEFRFIYVHVTANVEINGITFRNGLGDFRGGAIFSGFRSTLKVDNCKFYENKTRNNQGSFDQGGGAIMIASESRLSITNSYFEGNEANDFGLSDGGNGGGAVMCLLSNLVIDNCVFHKNKSSNNGGGLYTDGALDHNGTFSITNCIFTENISEFGSGAFLNYIYNNDVSVVENCHFENNRCSTGHGGAIFSGAGALNGGTNQTQVTFQNCSIISNESGQYSGGIFVNEHHTKLINCTIAQNTAPELATGLFVAKNRLSFSMENITIAENTSSGNAPGVFVAEANRGNLTLKNSIIANNDNLGLNGASKDSWTVQGNNIQFPNDDFGSGITVADPLLEAPAANGAFTKTMALKEGSPAIDAASDCSERDQRYALRVGNCDIGAYEFGGEPENNTNLITGIENPNSTPNALENIKAFNILTPNGDGQNDTWRIDNLTGNYIIKVFTKTGQIVFETQDINNQTWDGTNNNQELPEGVYYYAISIEGVEDVKTGYVTLIK